MSSNGIDREKKALRAEIRGTVAAPPNSAAVCEHLAAWLENLKLRRLFAYLSLPNEVDLLPLLWRFAERLEYALPVVLDSHRMEFFRFHPEEQGDLVVGRFKVAGPDPSSSRKMRPENGDLILVPSIAVSKKGERLGYGGGYYDRYLASCPELLKIGVPQHQKLLPHIPTTSTDISLNGVVTVDALTLID